MVLRPWTVEGHKTSKIRFRDVLVSKVEKKVKKPLQHIGKAFDYGFVSVDFGFYAIQLCFLINF